MKFNFDFIFPERSTESELKKAIYNLAEENAISFKLDVNLVKAIIYQESYLTVKNWKEAIIAVRYEPAFYDRYIMNQTLVGYIPKNFPPSGGTERRARAFSFGLMQIMGQTAREHNFDRPYLSQLIYPATNIYYGCKILASKIRVQGSEDLGIRAYNGNPKSDRTAEYLKSITNLRGMFKTGEL